MYQFIAGARAFTRCRTHPPTLSTISPASLRRTFVNRAATKPVPSPQPQVGIDSPETFLRAIGRSADAKVKDVPDWDALWRLDGHALKAQGVAVKDRRYILWCMEKYRQGEPIKQFAHEPKPKKKVRGHGPKVQNGKVIRSRRHRIPKSKS